MADHKTKVADLYVPRKCSWTNRLIASKEHDSVQINIGHINEHGVYTGTYTEFAFSGDLRSRAEVDQAVNRLAARAGLMKELHQMPEHHKYSEESQ